MSIIIAWKFPKLAAKLKGAKHELQLFLAAQLQTNRGMLFSRSGDFNGHESWKKPLLREGQPLSKSGTLRKSLGPNAGAPGPNGIVRFNGPKVTIGTQLAYAEMANWGTSKLPGGKLVARDGHALKIPLPAGKRATATAKAIRASNKKAGAPVGFMFVKSVKIDPRRFDDLTEADQKEISKAYEKKLKSVVTR